MDAGVWKQGVFALYRASYDNPSSAVLVRVFGNHDDFKFYWDEIHNPEVKGGNPFSWRQFHWFLYKSCDGQLEWMNERRVSRDVLTASVRYILEDYDDNNGIKRQPIPRSKYEKSYVH
ncbi:hypothetical protein COU00_00520 [Candidatus Falkowbacteria bacterium CG10_big_fil_rev_8_21_14_0_10_43_11]|uniref:Uncharacterized protein n=1 Tax=Candidatus Falkowbacteria bacterium CG10_big_fil_rev_8_21_14_0_10_43_11 TaxID=1974568 RepID=A0A2M6WMY4_9BACT|nr:MAG: hypothetical protein COU00_00520 [Candidatus Falkowbacteria bacterium CG10_big_fil_rev_8_21_14_0_10_43_11]